MLFGVLFGSRQVPVRSPTVPRPPSPRGHYAPGVASAPPALDPASADHQRLLDVPADLDVARTLAPVRLSSSDPTSARHGDTYWKALRTAAGPATVAVRRIAAGEAGGWAWGPGAELALARLEDWLGFDDNLESFDPSPHPVVAGLARRRAGVRMGRFGDLVERLVPTVFGQLVLGKEAKRSYRRLVVRFGEPAPGPLDLRLAPAPVTLAELGSHQFHRLGVERRRAEIVGRIARAADRLDPLVDLPRDEAYRRLRTIRGIGPWTATSVGRVAFGDPDAVIVGDHNLPHTVAWALAGKRRSTDEEMLELLAPFAGHRGRVQGLLKAGGKPPRHGPRTPFRELERH